MYQLQLARLATWTTSDSECRLLVRSAVGRSSEISRVCLVLLPSVKWRIAQVEIVRMVCAVKAFVVLIQEVGDDEDYDICPRCSCNLLTCDRRMSTKHLGKGTASAIELNSS